MAKKTLVLAEKPSVGKDIARVLGCKKVNNGSVEGARYVVTWALGHLVTLADPERYDKKYEKWEMDYLPMIPEHMKTEVIRQSSRQYNNVKTLLHRADVQDIVIATDAGREGELVARLIIDKAGCKKPCKRLWISSVTDKAIREGFDNLKSSKEYDNLYRAAISRAEADWLVGINATRALTCKYNAQLSCGRVQTPTLSMVAKREEEIKKFSPKPYYCISASAKTGSGVAAHVLNLTWRDSTSGGYRTFSKERAAQIVDRANSGDMKVIHVDRKPKISKAPLLYDLTELQRDANKRFGYSAKNTLDIMQRLYENHKVLTYPRTDSRYITTDIVPTIRERLKACGTGTYKRLASKLMLSKIEAKASFVNNNKVSDHHAIIPTEQYADFSKMSNDEKKIYDLVVRRFMAVLMPPCKYEETTIEASCAGESFFARGRVLSEKGWKEAYIDDMEEDSLEEDLKAQTLPNIETGKVLKDVSYRIEEGLTKPPARFTEATLLSAMENPVKYMSSNNKKMADTLTATGGLGTVATRADIIEKLFANFLLEKRGNDLYTTSKARQLLKLAPDDLKKPELTAGWEMQLSRIASGKMGRNEFMSDIKEYTKSLITKIKSSEGTFIHDNLTNKICPRCGKRLLAVNGKNSRMLVCQDRECGYREVLARITNARCPQCHKKMELIGSGEDALFVCACGRKERLSKFEERRKREGAGVTKKDVAAYMKKQQRESKENINNAFADALKNIKLD